MGRIHHEVANNHVSSSIHRQTHSSDVFAETVFKEWGKMQKGEAREGDAWTNAAELRSEEQKSGGGYWTSQTRRSPDSLHRRDTFFETINQTPRVGEEKNSNLTVNQEDVYVGFRSVITGMTEEHGIGLIKIHEQACTGEDFRDYLK